jgi:hypothetical protein
MVFNFEHRLVWKSKSARGEVVSVQATLARRAKGYSAQSYRRRIPRLSYRCSVPRRTAAEAPAGAGYEADAPSQLIAAHRMNHYSTPSSLLARATPWLSSERPSANFVTDYFAIFLVT